MSEDKRPLGGVELGGTKVVCAVGSAREVVAHTRLRTETPEATLDAVAAWFAAQAPAGLRALGVGSFGPVELRRAHPRFGFVTTTPKPGWSDVDVAGGLATRLGVPVAFDTDVNAAALAEGHLGGAQDVENFVYVTVGTGIGGGAIVNGKPVHGLVHPEMGHVSVPRQPGDDFTGACPYHGDCLEGMAAGPALRARFGVAPDQLTGRELDRATDIASSYVAAGLRNVVYALAPERIVLGGGISSMPGFVASVGARLGSALGGYPGLREHDETFVISAQLEERAGVVGALLLAEDAARR